MLVLPLLAALIAVACGDDDDGDPPEAGATAGVERELQEDTPLARAVASAPARLNTLPSYRYRSELEVSLPEARSELGAQAGRAEAEGEAIPPGRIRQATTLTVGSLTVEEHLLRIPEGEFVDRGAGYEPGLGELDTIALSVPVLWEAMTGLRDRLPSEVTAEGDHVDGVEATHYVLDQVRLLFPKDLALRMFGAVESADALPEEYRLEFWVANESELLLRLLIEGQADDGQGMINSFRLDTAISDIGEELDIDLP
ncbi:MAG: hypothetical protein GEU28_01245 [Dehalococcoidia bacterium]|nr:hypothetical protein [Dehalococcoidia bacterium]